MTEISSSRNRRFLTRPAARFRLAFTIWSSLALLAWVVYQRRQSGIYLTTSQLFVAILLAGFAGMLSYFAWLMYIPTLRSRGENDIPLEKFFAGLATLISPCVIGLSVLPIGGAINPWFVGVFLIIGCFALLTPHQAYLLTRRTRRMALLDPRLQWSRVRTRDVLSGKPDFSRLDYTPTTLASTYARTMTRLYDDKPRSRSYDEPVYEAPMDPLPRQPFHESDQVVQDERVIRPTPIAPATHPYPEDVSSKVDFPPAVERPVRPAPAQRSGQPGAGQAVFIGATTAATAGVLPRAEEPGRKDRKKNKKQRRRERREARARETQEAKPPVRKSDTPAELRDFVDEDGRRCIEGLIEAVFQPGQKRTYAHVAFNPTFDRKPEVICELADDSDVRLKSPQAFSYGTRLELTRKTNVQLREVVGISLFACAEAT